MNLVIKRTNYREDGIFSQIMREDTGEELMVSLEHAYPSDTIDNAFVPKLPPGTYICQRGMHRLHGMTEDFETFEILGVDGHSGILFHVGNFNSNSEGCVCVGEMIYDRNPDWMVTKSEYTFERFMQMQAGINLFSLTVVE